MISMGTNIFALYNSGTNFIIKGTNFIIKGTSIGIIHTRALIFQNFC